MGRALFFAGLVFILSACFPLGRDFPAAPVRNIQNGTTRQQEIFADFGEPIRRGLQNGYETWTYSYQYYEFGQLKDSKELYVVFDKDKDKTVRSYSFTSR